MIFEVLNMFRRTNFVPLILLVLVVSPFIQAKGKFGKNSPKHHTRKHRQHRPKHHLELTAEQREVMKNKVDEMRADGADKKEIRRQINQMLIEFGIDQPAPFNKFFDQLTEEQKLQIDTKIKEMREAGENREVIKQQIHQTLNEFGIDIPAKVNGKCKLNSEQKERAQELIDKGADEGEVQEALADLAIIDAAIAAAPQPTAEAKLRLTNLGQIKTNGLN